MKYQTLLSLKSNFDLTIRESNHPFQKKKKKNILTEDQQKKKSELEEKRKAHINKVADEQKKNVVEKILNDTKVRKDKNGDGDRKGKNRGNRSGTTFGPHEVVVKYSSSLKHGTSLTLPRFYEYIPLLLPNFKPRPSIASSHNHGNILATTN